MTKPKVYVGNGTKFSDFDQVSISICLEDIESYAKPAKNGKHYIGLVVLALKEKNQWGKTHTVYVDQWEKKTPEEVGVAKATQQELSEQYGPTQNDVPIVEDGDFQNIPF